MLKWNSLLLALSLPFIVQAQAPSVEKQQEELQDHNQEIQSEISYKYGQGWSDSIYSFRWLIDEQVWNPTSRITEVYNSGGLLVERINENYSVDSHSWLPFSKRIFAYDSHGNSTLYESYHWQALQQKWELQSEIVSRYSSTNKLLDYSLHSFDYVTQKLYLQYTTSTLFNSEDNIIETSSINYDRSGLVHSKNILEYEYDENGFAKEIIKRNWYQTTGTWSPQNKINISCDENGQELDRINLMWNGASYEESYRTVSRYNDALVKYDNRNYFWDPIEKRWDVIGRTESSYLNDTLIENMVSIYFSGGMGMNSTMVNYAYDANHNLTEMLYKSWQDDWVDNSKTLRKYDSKGNNTELRTLHWDPAEKKWMNNYQVNYQYDARGLMLQSITKGTDWNTNVWSNLNKVVYKLHKAVQPAPNQNFNCNIPNPFSAGATVSCNFENDKQHKMSLMDLTGRQITDEKIILSGGQYSIDSKLPAGIYLLQIKEEGQPLFSRKIIMN